MPFCSPFCLLQSVWLRVAARIGASAGRGRHMTTGLRRDRRIRRLAGGGVLLAVCSAAGVARCQGQAQRLQLVGLAADARCRWTMRPGRGWRCWGPADQIALDGEWLCPLDQHHRPAGPVRADMFSAVGGGLLVRGSRAAPGKAPLATKRGAPAGTVHRNITPDTGALLHRGGDGEPDATLDDQP